MNETEKVLHPMSRRLRPYPSYKNSGVEWLGKIPTHWEIKPLKHGFIFNKGRKAQVLTASYIKEHPGIYPVYSGQTENDGIMGLVDSFEYEFDEVLFSTTVGAKAMTPMTIKGRFNLSQNCLVMIPNDIQVSPRYFYYQLYPCFSYERAGIPDYMQPSLRISDLMRYAMAYPSLEEQKRIAGFLDRETAKIDTLIAKKERLIELLHEKRTALITQAVTKGLDPNVPIKDSGIEWLGQIPAHWDMKMLKQIGDLQAGSGFPEEFQGIETESIPFFKVGDMGLTANTKVMIDCPNTVSHTTAKILRGFIFPPDTIVFAKIGAALFLNRRRILSRPSCIDNNMMGFIPRDCDPTWGFYWLSTLDLKKLANPGAVPSVNEGHLRDTPAIVPPIHEQRAVGEKLDRETAKIDALITKIELAIERVNEYRAALISAAVTGKISTGDTNLIANEQT